MGTRKTTTGRKLATSLVVLLAFAAMVVVGTLAVFTDTQDVDANTFSTGTVDISTSPASALVTYSAMAPGDSVTNPLVVTNSGSLGLRYAIRSVATNTDGKGLKDLLSLTIKTVDVTTPASPCNDFDGTTLYTGDLDDGTGGKLVGDAAQGADTGDRALTAGSSETLCFRVSLAIGTGNAAQGATTTATFTFDAEQTKNN